MHEDRYGLALTTASHEAAAAYRRAADGLLAAAAGVDDVLGTALSADPRFALAHAAQARWLAARGRSAEARASIDAAVAMSPEVTARERGQIEVFRRMLAGDAPGALAAARDHLAGFPRDALVAAACTGVFGLIGFSGLRDREAQHLALLDGLAPHYGDDWWFLAAHAFAMVETGDWPRGRPLAQRALQLNPANANAAHVWAHVLYEAGELPAARAFLLGWLAGDVRDAPLHGHLWWHVALSELAEGRHSDAAGRLATQLSPAVAQSLPINTFTDAVSLLWRLRLAGRHDDASAWREALEFGRRHFPKPGVFVDVHLAIATAAAGDETEFQALLLSLERADQAGALVAGPVVPALARAMRAAVDGDWPAAAALLGHWMYEVVRIGGSRAQRDLFVRTLERAREP
jgi:Tfp pilus assembly protein PilF